jgi:hypothetical protein
MDIESNFIVLACRGGCGKKVTTTKQSLNRLDGLHAKYAGYCHDCMPLGEDGLLTAMGMALVDKLSS